MMEYLKKYGFQLSIIMYLVGFFVHNIYLLGFSVNEFEVLQTRYIYTGVSSIVIIFLIFLFFILRLDFSNFKENMKPINLLNWGFRVIVFFWVTIQITGTKTILYSKLSNNFNDTFSFIFNSTLNVLCIIYILGLLHVSFGSYFSKDDRIINFFKWVFSLLLFPLLFLFYFLSSNNSDLSGVFWFSMTPGLWVFMFICVGSDYERGIKTKAEALKNPSDNFSKYFLDKLYLVFIPLILFILFLSLYSKHIYPNIPSNIGGAKPSEVIITTNENEYRCFLLNESSIWYLLQKPDSTIIRIKIEDIKSVKLVNK